MSAPNEFSIHRFTPSTRALALLILVWWMGCAGLLAYLTVAYRGIGTGIWDFSINLLAAVWVLFLVRGAAKDFNETWFFRIEVHGDYLYSVQKRGQTVRMPFASIAGFIESPMSDRNNLMTGYWFILSAADGSRISFSTHIVGWAKIIDQVHMSIPWRVPSPKELEARSVIGHKPLGLGDLHSAPGQDIPEEWRWKKRIRWYDVWGSYAVVMALFILVVGSVGRLATRYLGESYYWVVEAPIILVFIVYFERLAQRLVLYIRTRRMQRTPLLAPALEVTPVGVDAQVPDLEETRVLAEQGHAGAQSDLGVMYERGDGVLEDYAEAVRLFRLAAEQGDANAQTNLGNMYVNGEGVPEDYAEAVRLFRLAAEQGLARAQYNLGIMYSNGRGVPEDDAERVRWYRLAAEQGYANAQTNLGNMYVNGEGVPRDMVLAYMWFDIAAAQGHEGAQRNRGLVRGLMTREQIDEAQRLSREWLEAHPSGD